MTTNRPKYNSIAIIGAGLAGLTAARRLAKHGLRVTLFDKGRGPGGRMSTRRAADYHFDHGAQYFSSSDTRFAEVVAHWTQQGVAASWDVPIAVVENGLLFASSDDAQRYVGTPDMDAIIAFLASACDVRFETQASSLRRTDGQWTVVCEDSREPGGYDVVLLAVPPAQALQIVGTDVSLAEPLRLISMLPCWAVMVACDGAVDLPFDAAVVCDSAISWAARNGSKPRRPTHECWVLHASAPWSLANIDMTPDHVCETLLDAFSQATGTTIPEPVFVRAHRWRYAKVDEPLGVDSLWDRELALGICGDWCLGSRVEDAVLSGFSLAGRLLQSED